jgi:hypothetical protein
MQIMRHESYNRPSDYRRLALAVLKYIYPHFMPYYCYYTTVIIFVVLMYVCIVYSYSHVTCHVNSMFVAKMLVTHMLAFKCFIVRVFVNIY